ncbi:MULTISPECIES: ATP-binding protein [unclassified Methylobacterium]|uniref:HAMP domain-containing sensor histidine kinase n=1 Tax=unclassified Methylobacterium TaxID=2615210 RepID=UPI0006906D13|nr:MULTISPECIES: ATP-binding protein [unclassified Methylobacterium]SFV09982.1 Signal transduction histidine kinase [Methylobacterium sp. UNCCL125]
MVDRLRSADLFRSTAIRWALGIALWSLLLALAMFAFVYWQTADYLREELAETLRLEVRAAAADPGVAATRVDTWIAMDVHATHYGGLFAPDGTRRAGNLGALPARLARDGDAYRVSATVDLAGRSLQDEIWAAALALADGSTVVIAHDTDEIDRVKATILRALGLGLVPTLALSALGGLLLTSRARRRLAATEAAVAEVMRGDLGKRLPVGLGDDEFDRLTRTVNRMLDEIEHLMGEVRSVGDAVAHDLRTPLTRLRARLERTRSQARTVAEFHEAIDQGLVWIDQTLAMVTAVLRIGEMEDGRRRGAFTRVDLGEVAAVAVEFHAPLAEEKDIDLALAAPDGPHPVHGDRDLCFEALSNLLDNALKFTPPGGRVAVGLQRTEAAIVVTVADTGPGLPPGERSQVFHRFYRAEAARQTPGHGLGLSLVAAIADLHGAPVGIRDAAGGGCHVELRFPHAEAEAGPRTARSAPSITSGPSSP